MSPTVSLPYFLLSLPANGNTSPNPSGVPPALQFSKNEMSETLMEGTGRSGSSVRQRTRKALVVCEVALSLILPVGTGLMIRSFWKLQHVGPGFDASNVLTLSVGLPSTRYAEPQQQHAFFTSACWKS